MSSLLQPPQQVNEVLGLNRTRTLGPKQESSVSPSRDAVLKALPLPLIRLCRIHEERVCVGIDRFWTKRVFHTNALSSSGTCCREQRKMGYGVRPLRKC